jgi:hypothetical protein
MGADDVGEGLVAAPPASRCLFVGSLGEALQQEPGTAQEMSESGSLRQGMKRQTARTPLASRWSWLAGATGSPRILAAAKGGPRILAAATLIAVAGALVFDLPARLADPGQLMGLRDHWNFYLPQAVFFDGALQRGELPMWNPLLLGGTPFAANPNSFVFYPPYLLRGLLDFAATPLSAHYSIAIMTALHLLIAGVGAYLFARDHELSFGASLTTAFVFVFSAGFVRHALAGVFVTTAAWLPFVLLFLRRCFLAVQLHERIRQALFAGLFFGLALLAGSPHMTLLMSVCIACWGAGHRFIEGWPSGRAPREKLTILAGDLGMGVLVFALAAGIASVILVPAMEFSSLSLRGHMPNRIPSELPDAAWLLRILSTYWGEWNFLHDYRLAGLGSVVLGLAALSHPRRRAVLLYLFLFYVFVDISIGPPLPFSQLFIHVAPYRLNSLSRAMTWACFPLAMLAGYGVDATARRWAEGRFGLWQSLLCLGVGGLLLSTLYGFLPPRGQLPVSHWVMLLPGIMLAVVAAAGLGPRREKHSAGLRVAVGAALAFLLLVEIAVWNRGFIPFTLSWLGYDARIDRPLAREATPDLWADNRRLASKFPNQPMLDLEPSFNGYDSLYIARAHRALLGETRYQPYLTREETVEESHRGNLFLKRSFWLARRYAEGSLPAPATLFPAASTVFLTSPPPGLPLPRIERDALAQSGLSGEVERSAVPLPSPLRWKREKTKTGKQRRSLSLPELQQPPLHGSLKLRYRSDTAGTLSSEIVDASANRAYVGKRLAIEATGGGEAELELPLPDFASLRITLHAEFEDPSPRLQVTEAWLESDLQDEDAHIRIVSRSANAVEVEVRDLPGPRLLTFVDPHYPGWKAWVDAQPADILLANEAFKAVLLPRGTHRVRFEFRPASVRRGAAVSLLSLALASVYLLLRTSPTQSMQGRGESG